MAFMRVAGLDPNCPNCIGESTVELFDGNPCSIRVIVKLAPPPEGTTFPGNNEDVTFAELKYFNAQNNSAKELAASYETWTSGSTKTITFNADAWLTENDFDTLEAQLEVRTDQPRSVYKWWLGLE